MPPIATEETKATGATLVTLLIIDPQNDFHPGGTLAIPTADEDAARIATFIREHARHIDRIVVTLDSHQRIHIAHGIFWVNGAGERPPPFTLISSQDVARGTWRALDASKQLAAEEYARKLEEGGRFMAAQICIWPEHCIIGSPGHNVRAAILSALSEWAESRMREVMFVWKGQNCLTEMYSALRAEVPVPSDERTLLNVGLLRTLKESSQILVCGQALSHCVNFTVRDLADTYEMGDADRIGTIGILSDCASSVPGFEEAGTAFLADMKRKGIRIVTSESWTFM